MSEFQTLDELKAANAAAEAEQPEVDEQDVEQVEEVEAADEIETDDDAEAQGESEVEEEWLKGDSEQSQAVPLSKHVEMRHKLKARLSEKDSELDQLRQEVERLKAGYAAPQQQQAPTLKMPKLSDFDFDEDRYAEAMAGYQEQLLESKLAQKLGSREQQQAQQVAEQRRNEKVEQHYERAAKLVSSTPGFTEEKYKAADYRVRQELHTLTGNGDLVTDELIARLGEGSERVIAHLGINAAKLETLKQKLAEDNSGIAASIWLGELKSDLNKAKTVNKLSKAPKPDGGLKGDAGGVSVTGSNLLKQVKAARDSGDIAKVLQIKAKAKANGIDTSNW